EQSLALLVDPRISSSELHAIESELVLLGPRALGALASHLQDPRPEVAAESERMLVHIVAPEMIAPGESHKTPSDRRPDLVVTAWNAFLEKHVREKDALGAMRRAIALARQRRLPGGAIAVHVPISTVTGLEDVCFD